MLGDRGENLSSVLYEIRQDPQRKEALLEWAQELIPMDAKDFEFPSDFTGKVLLTFVEGNGQRVSAYSASDGILRFLAMLAALLGSEPAQFYFFEELDNGIHPTRLHLLLQLIEQKVPEGKIQMVAF
ncbi:MAG: ATP-binding protein [Tildeniella nuda ZEHNDER 1965/U140]|nr:ATP-binding protein [Tildeniella nuda ZEHNDER 1965/U140]